MMTIQSLIAELDERALAQTVGIPHDEMRMRYRLRSNTVTNFDDFSLIIAHYYSTHFTTCISKGGRLSRSQAASKAKEIIEQEFRRKGGDIVTAFNDAKDGTNGGMRRILDIIAEKLKEEAIEYHIRDTFDRYVTPNSWRQKVKIIKQFIQHYGRFLGSAIKGNQPERYAQNYRELIGSYVSALRATSGIFRRL
jgi:hypothetical protein